MTVSSVKAEPAPFYGWRVVAAAFVVAVFGWGVGFYGPPVYLEAVRAERGWSVGLVSGAVTAHFLAGVRVVANLPRLHRRFGLPRVTFAGAVALAFGVLGWSLAAAPWQLYAATLLSGAGWVTLGAAGVNAMIAPWFARKRPAALSTAYNGASVGGVIFSPLWAVLVAAWGFPFAAALVGVLMAATLGALAATVLRRTPESMGQTPDGAEPATSPAPAVAAQAPLRNPWRDGRFLTLAAGMSLALFAQIGVIAHLVSLLAASFGARGAGLAAGLSTAAAIVGRTGLGWLLPSGADRRRAAAASLVVQMAGLAAMAASGTGADLPLAVAGVVLFGLGIGNATSLPPLIAQVEFAKDDVPRAVALAVATAQAIYAFAPALFGLAREGMPPEAVLALAGAVQALACLAFLSGRARRG